ANARAVEADALAEEAPGQFLDRDGEVLPGPDQVDELEIDDLERLLVGEVDDGLGIRPGFLFCAHTLVDRHRQNPSVEPGNPTLPMLGVPLRRVIGPKKRVAAARFVRRASGGARSRSGSAWPPVGV